MGGEGAPGGGASSRPQSWSWCFRAISGDPGAPTCPQARNYVSQVLQIGAAEVTASLRPGEEQEGPRPSLGGRRGRRAWIKGLPKSPAPCVVCSQQSPYTPAHPGQTPPGARHQLALQHCCCAVGVIWPPAASGHSHSPRAAKTCPAPISQTELWGALRPSSEGGLGPLRTCSVDAQDGIRWHSSCGHRQMCEDDVATGDKGGRIGAHTHLIPSPKVQRDREGHPRPGCHVPLDLGLVGVVCP